MASPTALLVVHGIGAQERGETLRKLTRGLQLIDPGFEPTPVQGAVVATLGGRPVRLYEVYWADLLKGDVVRRTFLINELQSLSWFPLFNLRRGNYRQMRYGVVRLAWWTLALPVLNFLLLFAYYGAATIAEIVTGTGAGPRRDPRARPTALDRLLDEYVGDVFNYVNAAGQAFYRERDEPPVPEAVRTVFPQIVRRFHDQLRQAVADGCDTIQVVAHSLGTVVTYHALSEAAAPSDAGDATIADALARVRRIYTLGCPLEKVRFFWPRLLPLRAPAASALRWDNFVSFFDPVSGHVRTFTEWGRVSNHRLLGGGFFSGHVVYERSPVFLRTIAEGVAGHAIPYRHGTTQWVRDACLLAGETLAAPVTLGAVLLLGASLYVAVAMLIPYLLSWTVRWFMPPERWSPIVDTLSFVFLGMMTLTFLVAPALRAKRVHAMFWAAADEERPTTAAQNG